MPRDANLKKVLVLGSGPIVIGQAAEFDYSGTQAVKALREEGIEVVLWNSNPATIMTDPTFADRTYIEPMTAEVGEAILAREKPDAVLPTMGGQTALNLAKALAESGALARHGVRLLGANLEAINKAEDRLLFKAAMAKIGVPTPKSGFATNIDEALGFCDEIGFPAIIRPSFTLGGTGGGIAYNREEYEEICRGGLDASPTSTILVEQSVLGWKEYELEVVRDRNDNAIIVCSIENLDPMGVHTGDSITVAPAMTLTDREYQVLRDYSIRILREIGVDTGGSNVQFGVNPADGGIVVIEMNPRVSRSSALASKATGYPIAKVATKLAIGYTLDELPNDITQTTKAAFEPAIDYVVTKIPRFAFEKFPHADRTLTTMMRSVGEVMAIGRTFRESFLKALRSMDQGAPVLQLPEGKVERKRALADLIRVPRPDRIAAVFQGFREGLTVADVHDLSKIDPFFLHEIHAIVVEEKALAAAGSLAALGDVALAAAKRNGFSDAELGRLVGASEGDVRRRRIAAGIVPTMKRVDTCAGEFPAFTPYLYASYEAEDEAPPTDRKKVIVLGSGPIRIGQGIEFDYCCVHASFALAEAGFETIMLNCNPETVSTDYDTSDRLYFEPVTLEDVLTICRREKPMGVIVQFGGQTPLKLAKALELEGVPILGTPPDAIDRAEDRERFSAVVEKLGLLQPQNGLARTEDEAQAIAARIGFPVVVRPSYVLGGRAMEVVGSAKELARYMREAVHVSPDHPILIDRFLDHAIEVDVDAVVDRTGSVQVAGILEHIEEAGVHSGDAACVLPPHSLSSDVIERMKDQVLALARELGVIGLINVQFAIQGKSVYLLEVNPRASRTVPFVAKATGFPLAKVAALAMAGKTFEELGAVAVLPDAPPHFAVKESVFPFARFDKTDVLLGPEMRSTGEVMGIAPDAETAFLKAQIGAGARFPAAGNVLLSVADDDKPGSVEVARKLLALGYSLFGTGGTAAYLRGKGIAVASVPKADEGRPHVVDQLRSGRFAFVVNTRSRSGAADGAGSYGLRREALVRGVPFFTTVEAARMLAGGLTKAAMVRASGEALGFSITPLQELLGISAAAFVRAEGGEGTASEYGARPFATASEIAGSGVASDGGPTSTGAMATKAGEA